MRNAKLQDVLLAATIGSACAVGCAAASEDPKSRELVAVTRLEHAPAGSLSVSDDGHYEFVDFSSKSRHEGTLSNSEIEMLEHHLASPRLETVYGEQDPDADRCDHEAAGLILHSRLGSACIVKTDLTDEHARESLEFLSTLFETKAAENK
jgi:hypothetical protein